MIENLSWFWHRLNISWKMSIRSAARNRSRFVITMVGVVFAVGMLVVSLFTIDAVNYMIESHFHQSQRYDYLIRFTSPVNENELLNITRMAGVNKAEALLEIPIKIKFNGKNEDDSITGLEPGTTLKRLRDSGSGPLQYPMKVCSSARGRRTSWGQGSVIPWKWKPCWALVPPGMLRLKS